MIRICSECGQPYEPRKYDHKGYACYKKPCREAFEEKQRLKKVKYAREWREQQKKKGIETVMCYRCRKHISEKLIVKLTDRDYCRECYGTVSDVFAYDVMYDTGCMIDEVGLFPTGPQMVYG